MMMSTARRRRAKSLGVICLILASLTCSPPTAAVIRPAEAEGADDESDENDVVAVGVGSLSPPEHEFEAEAFVHQRHTDSVRRQPQLGGSNNSILSKIESFFYWRGILGTYREDEDSIIDGQPQQRPEDYGLSPSSSASLRLETNRHGSTTATTRHLRSTTRPADMDQARQRRGSSRSRQASWFVDWSINQCVQSCDPNTSNNPNCAGLARWDDIQFDTAEYCCSITFFWKSFKECTDSSNVGSSSRSSNYDDGMTSLSSASSGGGSMVCSQYTEYSQFDGSYQSRDTVTIYDSPTRGRVYQCSDDANSLYCNSFPPDWKRVAPGGGSVHKFNLGWTLLGECQDDSTEQVTFSSREDPSCWRSGTECDTHAGKFACCTSCRNGVCV